MPVVKSQKEYDDVMRKEAEITDGEYKKFKKDKSGRLVVPKGYEPPSGFRGTVFRDGIELNYAGLRVVKQFDKPSTIAVGTSPRSAKAK